ASCATGVPGVDGQAVTAASRRLRLANCAERTSSRARTSTGCTSVRPAITRLPFTDSNVPVFNRGSQTPELLDIHPGVRQAEGPHCQCGQVVGPHGETSMGQKPRELHPYRSPTDFFGAELRRLRSAHALSLQQLSSIVHYDASLLAKIERAERTASRDLTHA